MPFSPAAPASRKTLLELAEELKVGLTSHATGGAMDAMRYVEIRKTLLAAPDLAERLPRFLKACRSTDDFWGFIKQQFRSYQERRDFLATELNPILDFLDDSQSTADPGLSFGEPIDRGGFGTVYKARHELLQMDFAVKVFDPAFDDGSPAHLDRFFREARVLFALNHPNIVRVFDVGLRYGKPFIRMEYFEGKNLSEFLKDHGRLSPRKALVLTQKVLEGLVHAHVDARVVHRDLKPSNVMVAPGERVRIVDFGLGVFIERDLVSRITKTGEAAVGGYYTAPELVINPKLVDPRSDLYSVSGIWYTALTNRAPAGLDLAEQLRANIRLPSRYEKALLRGFLAPDTRYGSAQEMLETVKELYSDAA